MLKHFVALSKNLLAFYVILMGQQNYLHIYIQLNF